MHDCNPLQRIEHMQLLQPYKRPSPKGCFRKNFWQPKWLRGTWGTVILTLNTPGHCLKLPRLLTSPHSTVVPCHGKPHVWSHCWFSQACSLLSTNLFPSLCSPPNSSNAPNTAHANPDASLCLYGLQDSREMAARVAVHLELHLCWKDWQCRPGTCSASQCKRTDSDCSYPKLLPSKINTASFGFFFFFPLLSKEICLDLCIIKGKTYYMVNILSEHFRQEAHTEDLSPSDFINTRYLLWNRKDCRLGQNTIKPGYFLICHQHFHLHTVSHTATQNVLICSL